MKKIISITSYNNPNLLVHSEGLSLYNGNNEEVLSGVVPFYMDLTQTGTSHAGTTSDPWSYADFIANKASLPEGGTTVLIRGMSVETADPYVESANGDRWVIWDKWGSDPWRIEYNKSDELLASNIVLRNGIIYKSGGPGYGYDALTIGANAGTNHINMLLQVTSADHLKIRGSISYYGCSFKSNGNLKFWDSKTIIDSTFEGAIQLFGSITTDHCSFSVASAPGTHTNAQWSWPAGVAWPAYNAAKELFASSILGATLATPAQPGTPPYTGYATDMWGSVRAGIGGFYLTGVIPPTPPPTPTGPAFAHSTLYKAGRSNQIRLDEGEEFSPGRFTGTRGVIPFDVNFPE